MDVIEFMVVGRRSRQFAVRDLGSLNYSSFFVHRMQLRNLYIYGQALQVF